MICTFVPCLQAASNDIIKCHRQPSRLQESLASPARMYEEQWQRYCSRELTCKIHLGLRTCQLGLPLAACVFIHHASRQAQDGRGHRKLGEVGEVGAIAA